MKIESGEDLGHFRASLSSSFFIEKRLRNKKTNYFFNNKKFMRKSKIRVAPSSDLAQNYKKFSHFEQGYKTVYMKITCFLQRKFDCCLIGSWSCSDFQRSQKFVIDKKKYFFFKAFL